MVNGAPPGRDAWWRQGEAKEVAAAVRRLVPAPRDRLAGQLAVEKGALPSPHRRAGRGEELVRDLFELGWRQEAGGRAVVLPSSSIVSNRLLLGAAIDGAKVSNPWLPQAGSHSLVTELGERPARHGNVPAHDNVRMGDEVKLARRYLGRCLVVSGGVDHTPRKQEHHRKDEGANDEVHAHRVPILLMRRLICR